MTPTSSAALRLRRLSPQIVLTLIAGLLLWAVLRSVSVREVGRILGALTPQGLLLLALANLGVLVILAGRWWILLRALGWSLPYRALMGYRLAAFSLSYFTPGSHFGGEPLQVYLTSERQGVPVTVSVASVAMDKLIEMTVNFLFLAAGVLFVVGVESEAGRLALFYPLLLLALPLTLLAALWRGHHPVSGLGEVLLRRWPTAWGRTITDGARHSEVQMTWLCRQRPGALLAALAISFVGWAALLGEYWLMTYVLGLELSPAEALFAMLAARIAILLPLPAGLGALELSQVVALRALGAGGAAGLSLSVLIRARDVLLGVLGLWIGGVGLWTLRRSGGWGAR